MDMVEAPRLWFPATGIDALTCFIRTATPGSFARHLVTTFHDSTSTAAPVAGGAHPTQVLQRLEETQDSRGLRVAADDWVYGSDVESSASAPRSRHLGQSPPGHASALNSPPQLGQDLIWPSSGSVGAAGC